MALKMPQNHVNYAFRIVFLYIYYINMRRVIMADNTVQSNKLIKLRDILLKQNSPQAKAKAQWISAFVEADKNHNGVLEGDEIEQLSQLLAGQTQGTDASKVKTRLLGYDDKKTQDGKLDVSELSRVANDLVKDQVAVPQDLAAPTEATGAPKQLQPVQPPAQTPPTSKPTTAEVVLGRTGAGQNNRVADLNTPRNRGSELSAQRQTTPTPPRREREEESGGFFGFLRNIVGEILGFLGLGNFFGGQDNRADRWYDRRGGYDNQAYGQNVSPELVRYRDSGSAYDALAGLPDFNPRGSKAGRTSPPATDTPQGVLRDAGLSAPGAGGTTSGIPEDLRELAIDNGITPDATDTVESLTKKIMDNLKAEAAERHIDIIGCNDIDSILAKMPDGPSEDEDHPANNNGQNRQETATAKFSKQAGEYAKLHDAKLGAWTGPVNKVRQELSALYKQLAAITPEDPDAQKKIQPLADKIGKLENKLQELYPKNFEASANGLYKAATEKAGALQSALDGIQDTPENKDKRLNIQTQLTAANHNADKWNRIQGILKLAHERIAAIDAKIQENMSNKKSQEGNPDIVKGIDASIQSLIAEKNGYLAQINQGKIWDNKKKTFINLEEEVENGVRKDEITNTGIILAAGLM